MAREPEDMVLVQLRAIRATLDDITTHLDAAEKRHEELRGWVIHCLGLCSIHHLKNEEQDARLSAGELRAKHIEEIQEALRTRVHKLEEQRGQTPD